MVDEVYIKKIELADSKKASLKTKWKKHEDRLMVEIYIGEDSSVYIGSCSQEVLRKKKEDINVEYDTIKSSLTSFDVQENISYELDEKNLKFTVVEEDALDSDYSFGSIIYLKIDLKKVESIVPIMMQTIDDMFENLTQIAKLESERDQYKEDLKVLQEMYEQAVNEKVKFDKTVYERFNAVLKSKKKRVAELEHKLEKSNQSNKLMNLSSDFDQSDKEKSFLQVQQVKATPKKSKIYSSQSSDDAMESQKPSTSKSFRSPARRKTNSRNNSPRTGSVNSPRTRTQGRTPKKLSLSPRKSLFQFISNDSDELDDSEPKELEPAQGDEDMFSGLSFKITQKDYDSQELNPSSAELLIPTKDSRKRLNSTSSEASQKARDKSADFIEPAQVMDLDNHSEEIEKKEEDLQHQSSAEEPFTQKYIDDEPMENSQPLSQANESPSIFDKFPKRKLRSTSDSISKRTRLGTRSKFSLETVNILFDDSL